MKQQAIAYTRISIDKQASGFGMEAQRQAISDYANRNNISIIAEYSETISGKSDNRKELIKALEHCCDKKLTLVIAKLDRLSRSVAFIAKLIESKVEFIVCDCPNANKMTIQMLSVFAEHERDMISKRTKEAMATPEAKERHRLGLLNSEKLQSRIGNRLEHDTKILAVISTLKERGVNSYNAIAGHLKALGLQTRTGGTNWDATRVRNIVLRHPGTAGDGAGKR